MSTSDHPFTKRREKRLLSVGFAVGCFLGLIVFTGALTAIGSLRNCHEITRVYHVIQIQAERGLKSLPTIQYYKDHPAELAKAEQQTRAEIKTFNPPSCSSPF